MLLRCGKDSELPLVYYVSSITTVSLCVPWQASIFPAARTLCTLYHLVGSDHLHTIVQWLLRVQDANFCHAHIP